MCVCVYIYIYIYGLFSCARCRQRAAAGRPGADTVPGPLHHSEALQPRAAAAVCGGVCGVPGLQPRCGPVSEQRLGWGGCTGEHNVYVKEKND